MSGITSGQVHKRIGVALAAALLVAATPALAGDGWRQAGSAGFFGPRLRVDSSIRRAPYGQRNLVALLGASPDGSAEERYSTALHGQVGGRYLHGNYTREDLLDAIVPTSGARQPIANAYFTGHSVSYPRASYPNVEPGSRDPNYFSIFFAGKQNIDNALNYDDSFWRAYDRRMSDLNLSPRDVWAPNARVYLKPCWGNSRAPGFVDQLSRRLPEGASIEAYDTPFQWQGGKHLPFGVDNMVHWNLGRQQEGRVVTPGRWRPEPQVIANAASDPELSAAPSIATGRREASLDLSGE